MNDLKKRNKRVREFLENESSLWVGVAAGACALWTISLRLLDTSGALAVLSTLAAALLASTLAVLFRKRMWVAVLVSAIAFILAALYSARERAHVDAMLREHGQFSGYADESTLALIVATIMLSIYRMSAYPYLVLAIGSGYVFFELLGTWLGGILGFAATALILGFLNYFVQLIVDHQHEMVDVPRRWVLGLNLAELGRTLYIWLFAVIFIVGGLALNQIAQERLRIAIYQTGVIIRDVGASAKDLDRDLESDVLHTIEQARIADVRAYLRMMADTRAFGETAWQEFPFQTELFIESQRPGDLDSHEACKNAQTRVLGKSVTFRSMCRDVVNGVNGLVQSSFETTKTKLVDLATDKTAASEDEKYRMLADVQQQGIDAINAGYSRSRSLAAALFMLLSAYIWVGYLAVLCGMVAALQLVVGRVIFHDQMISSSASKSKQSESSQRFCLDAEAARDAAEKLDFSKEHEFSLSAKAKDEFSPDYWYLSAGTARRGVGTHMFLWLPQFWRCFFQRLFSRRLLMTRVAMRNVRALQGTTSACISVPGDCQLVPIKIGPNQSVVFRMRDLVAFSNGVKFRSIYTTYVGAYFLGLGAFYSVAEGGGKIILKSDGQQIVGSARGTSVPSVNLLAWDRRSEFGLAQSLGIFGVWFNDPNIVTCSVRRSAIIDEGSASRFPLALRFWRLMRYLFVPV